MPYSTEREIQSLMSVKVQAPFGARVQKVQKVQRVVVGAFGAIIYAACGGENRTTALRAWKCIPPLVAGATTFPPQAGALWMLSNGAMPLQESIERFILSPGWGKVRRSRIRGSRAAANHQNANQALWQRKGNPVTLTV